MSCSIISGFFSSMSLLSIPQSCIMPRRQPTVGPILGLEIFAEGPKFDIEIAIGIRIAHFVFREEIVQIGQKHLVPIFGFQALACQRKL